MHPHGSHPIVAFIALVFFLLGFMSTMASAADLSTLNKQIAEALLAALRDTGYQQKEIYLAMRYSKGQFSKVLSGEKALSIARLHRAPFTYYVAVWKVLIAIKARDFSAELREDAGVERRAVSERHAS